MQLARGAASSCQREWRPVTAASLLSGRVNNGLVPGWNCWHASSPLALNQSVNLYQADVKTGPFWMLIE